MSLEDIRKDRKTQEALLALLLEIETTILAGVRIQKWVEQKWVASVDEYNECRYDCEPVRLAAA